MKIRNRSSRGTRWAKQLAAALAVALLATACASDDETTDDTPTEEETADDTADESDDDATEEETEEPAEDDGDAAAAGDLAWCGDEPMVLGIQDGGGLNAWSVESFNQVREEAEKCDSVENTIVVNANFDPQAAISGLQGMIAQSVDSIVIIPTAGVCAELPAMQAATAEGITVVPWAADGCGEVGTDYAYYVDWDTVAAGRAWAQWTIDQMGGEGNLLFLGGPAGNTVDVGHIQGILEVVAENPGVEILEPISAEEWPVTNWDPAQGRQLMSSLLAEHDQIDGLIVDFGAVAEAAIRAFEQAGRDVPPVATTEANLLACTREELGNSFELSTVSSRNWLGRYAVQLAVAEATGGTPPTLVDGGVIDLGVYEDSTDANAQPLCDPSSPPDTFFSNDVPDDEQDSIAYAS